MRWITVGPADQPGTSIVLHPPAASPGITDDERRTIAEMMAKGTLRHPLLATTDLDGTFEQLQASGAEVVQEPTEQPYGVRDCAFRDPAGNLHPHQRAALSRRRRTRRTAHSRRRQHAADSHDLIRVHGARENNLRDVSVEIPKRRLTVFTGVSGSGKSSLVFGTIAAESQRMINETYSAFVQGFMPTLARPDVDVLDGLTTAIIVDQERMGANARSTVGTATDANAMLRILFSRLGRAAHRPAQRLLLQRPLGPGERRDHGRAGRRQDQDREGDLHPARRHVPALRGHGLGHRHRPVRSSTTTAKSLNEGALTIPGYSMEGWYRRIFRGCGFFDPDKPIRELHQEGAARPALPGAHQDQGRGHQPDLRGLIPQIQKSMPVQGRRRDAAAHPRLRGAGGHVHDLPRLRRHPAQPRRPGRRRSAGPTSPTPARCRSATWPTGCAGLDEPSVAPLLAALRHTLDSFVEIGLGYLSLDRPVGHPLGRRGAADQDDPPPRVLAHRRHLRLRRADRSGCTRTTSSG